MLTEVTIFDKKYNIPTSWADVPYKKYIELMEVESLDKQLQILTGITDEDLSRLSAGQKGGLLMLISFTSEAPDIYTSKDYKEIGKDTYGKLESAKIALQKVDKPYKAILDILKIYTGEDMSEEPTSIVAPIGAFFLLNCLLSSSDTNVLMITNQRQSI